MRHVMLAAILSAPAQCYVLDVKPTPIMSSPLECPATQPYYSSKHFMYDMQVMGGCQDPLAITPTQMWDACVLRGSQLTGIPPRLIASVVLGSEFAYQQPFPSSVLDLRGVHMDELPWADGSEYWFLVGLRELERYYLCTGANVPRTLQLTIYGEQALEDGLPDGATDKQALLDMSHYYWGN